MKLELLPHQDRFQEICRLPNSHRGNSQLHQNDYIFRKKFQFFLEIS